jgi:hypothetical protein
LEVPSRPAGVARHVVKLPAHHADAGTACAPRRGLRMPLA